MLRSYLKISLVAAFLIPLTIGSCKKQDKCGCDGDALGTLVETPVYIYVDVENSSAYFVTEFDPYSTYYFCNPSDMMDKMDGFDWGERVKIDCEFFWECNYMYQASNSYYGSMYKKYMADVTDVKEDLYGN